MSAVLHSPGQRSPPSPPYSTPLPFPTSKSNLASKVRVGVLGLTLSTGLGDRSVATIPLVCATRGLLWKTSSQREGKRAAGRTASSFAI